MQTIYEKLARCITEGEVQRMLKGNGMEIVPLPQSGSHVGNSWGGRLAKALLPAEST